jgi:hypothetical protein
MNNLAKFQAALKVPKGQENKFGNYKFRSAEDILEAVKKVINPEGFSIELTDELVLIGTRYYIKSTAILSNNTILSEITSTALAVTPERYSCTAYAREEEVQKGMNSAQITGSASSYARKYALNGLFAIDDTKDDDFNNKGEKQPEVKTKRANPPKSGETPKPKTEVPTPKKDELTPEHKSWNYVLTRLKEKVPMNVIKESFTISTENEDKLIKAASLAVTTQIVNP